MGIRTILIDDNMSDDDIFKTVAFSNEFLEQNPNEFVVFFCQRQIKKQVIDKLQNDYFGKIQLFANETEKKNCGI
jgi:hypothetical protein